MKSCIGHTDDLSWDLFTWI